MGSDGSVSRDRLRQFRHADRDHLRRFPLLLTSSVSF